MRIIAGNLGGRTFQSPRGHRTHPMSDKIRGAIFNMLGDVEGLTVLDAFAGSGALSLEAISRGAARAVAIDIDKSAQVVITRNAEALGLDQLKAIRANVSSWSDNNPEARFDIVFVAPPYDDVRPKLVQKLVRHAKPNGVLVLDWPGKVTLPELTEVENIAVKDYGDAQLAVYRKAT